jgi:hypothetical protein
VTKEDIFCLEPISKNGFWFPAKKRGIFDKIKAAARFPRFAGLPAVVFPICGSQPGGILLYFEDLNRAPNAEFGPKDFFEMGSSHFAASNKRGRKMPSGNPMTETAMPSSNNGEVL